MGSELNTPDKERQDHCRDAIDRYIDLSNEQAFLHDKKRITDETWMEWTGGITTNMKLAAFRHVWGRGCGTVPGYHIPRGLKRGGFGPMSRKPVKPPARRYV